MTRRIVTNPYPGARPLGRASRDAVVSGDRPLLLGRDEDVRALVALTARNRVIELFAASGVGKTSLLLAGYEPALKEQGYRTGLFASWSNLVGATPLQHYSSAVMLALAGTCEPLGTDENAEGYLERVDTKYGDALVLIFDQLEELLRDDERVGEEFIATAAAIAPKYQFHQVLSLRSEYVSYLRPVEENLGTLWQPFQLEPVSEDVIPALVQRPLTPLGMEARRQDIDCIRDLWCLATGGSYSDRGGGQLKGTRRTGLLHLQALLWVLFHRAASKRDALPTWEDLNGELRAWMGECSSAGSSGGMDHLGAEALLRAALKEYLEVALTLRADRFAERPEERDHARQTLLAVAAIAGHLSDGDYKLVRDTDTLAHLTIPEFKELRVSETAIGSSLEHLRRVPAEMGLPSHEELGAWVGERGFGNESGDDDMAAHRMRRHGALGAACELLVSYERALRWLDDLSVIRLAPTMDGRRVAALVHDGFGPALRMWGEEQLDKPAVWLEGVVALAGRRIFGEGPRALVGGNVESYGVESIGWLGCFVTADFINVVFDDCDFRGTVFLDCTFKDVEFRKCRLWGGLFLSCRFDSVIIDGSMDGGSQGLQTLVVKRHPQMEPSQIQGDGLVIRNLGGVGLFFQAVEGGPWRMANCTIEHISLSGGEKGLGPGSIGGGSRLRHVSLGDNLKDGMPTKEPGSSVEYMSRHDGS